MTQIRDNWREPMESGPQICPVCRGDCALTGCAPYDGTRPAGVCMTLIRRARALRAAQERQE